MFIYRVLLIGIMRIYCIYVCQYLSKILYVLLDRISKTTSSETVLKENWLISKLQ